MQDRPTIDELLEALSRYLQDDVMVNTTGRISFHARVSANVVEMIRRELATEEDHLAEEWAGLDGLLGAEARPATLQAWRARTLERNEELSRRIAAGDADSGEWRTAVFAHLRRMSQLRLRVSDPKLAAATAND
ncbi:MAG: hypothetical protein IT303_14150 [Dehalococcoidia bacterium]|nr:hypothetical protein [Dehalococcoidia bacterium]